MVSEPEGYEFESWLRQLNKIIVVCSYSTSETQKKLDMRESVGI
jgi:hypothetical protein